MAQTSAAGYPVAVTLPQERAVNRWWGLLWFGMLVRAILVIPHYIVLLVLGILLGLGACIVWIPILIFGKTPALWCTIATEIINRSTRINAYMYLFPGAYPALGMSEQGPVGITIDVGDRQINRLWGIPFFGWMFRFLVLIPQFVVLYILNVIAGLVALVVWIPILINGRYPDLGMKLMGWYLRYNARLSAYALLLPVPYPPITQLD